VPLVLLLDEKIYGNFSDKIWIQNVRDIDF
jgi:hypothetical protein